MNVLRSSIAEKYSVLVAGFEIYHVAGFISSEGTEENASMIIVPGWKGLRKSFDDLVQTSCGSPDGIGYRSIDSGPIPQLLA